MIYESAGSRLGRKILCAGVVLGVALFAFASNALAAAPVLLPTSVTEITSTSAVLRVYAESPRENRENSVVWFEWSEASRASTPTVFAMRAFSGAGFFDARLEGLTPGVAYSFRAAARGGTETVYSPFLTFTTLTSNPTPAVTQPVVTQTPISKTVQTKKQTVQTVAVKKATVATVATKESSTNGNSAAAIGAGNSLFPNTLIGWVVLLVVILVVILLGHMLYEAPEKRRKEREREEERTRRESM